MTGLTEYFSALTATAVIGVLVCSLIKDPKVRSITQTITGVLLLLVLLKPLTTVDLDRLSQEIRQQFRQEFQTTDYETMYQDKLRRQVRETTESYIINKASSFNAMISVEVELNREGYPTPCGVKITGILTEKQKLLLQEYLTKELGIPIENQRWDTHE